MTKRPTQINIQLDEPKYRGIKRIRYEALTSLRDQFIEQVDSLSGNSLSVAHNAGEDMADIGSDNFSREMGLSVASEEGKKVALIQDALKRLEKGHYGKCIDCKVEIEEGRLKAIPYAKLCIKCKTVREENEEDFCPSFGTGYNKDELTE
ncbi:MAG: TraR/DksA family transcriptional regulator [Lentisphaeraceae bacterium]|nr:TraR/DksA family transcriptional regulator [Lentisphaeraceae bacterium]